MSCSCRRAPMARPLSPPYVPFFVRLVFLRAEWKALSSGSSWKMRSSSTRSNCSAISSPSSSSSPTAPGALAAEYHSWNPSTSAARSMATAVMSGSRSPRSAFTSSKEERYALLAARRLCMHSYVSESTTSPALSPCAAFIWASCDPRRSMSSLAWFAASPRSRILLRVSRTFSIASLSDAATSGATSRLYSMNAAFLSAIRRLAWLISGVRPPVPVPGTLVLRSASPPRLLELSSALGRASSGAFPMWNPVALSSSPTITSAASPSSPASSPAPSAAASVIGRSLSCASSRACICIKALLNALYASFTCLRLSTGTVSTSPSPARYFCTAAASSCRSRSPKSS
mmetsp:Transcript_11170/g.36758  ORF Transcript_11170/g.36758 Transcript_11170/m.36758 type:complete len:344 (+) Transcript_11170:174-1205(+)